MTRIAEFLDAGGAGPVQKSKANGHYKPPVESKMTSREAVAAAKKAGMQIVSVKKLEGCRDLGRYASEIGVVKVGRAYLLYTAEHLRQAIDQCDVVSAKLKEPEAQANLLGVKDHFLEKLLDAANSMIKSAHVDASDGAHAAIPVGSFPIRQASVPANAVQVNIGVQAANPPDTNNEC